MDASTVAPVLRLARQVTDGRRHNFLHPLSEMIVMAVIAVLCGSDGWLSVAEFCVIRQDLFKKFLTLRHGIPSHDTFGRVFAQLDPAELEKMLREWMKILNLTTDGKLIAIDGKSLRRSIEHSWDTSGMAHVVSAFATENKVVLAQLGVLDKENEIVAIGKLLEMIDLQGTTVTMDAMGCQREFAKTIVQGNGDYILQVKDNQPNLHAKVKNLLNEARLENLVGWQGSQFQEVDSGHGRIETRHVWLISDVKDLGTDLLTLWPGLSAIVAIERTREIIGQPLKTSIERSYYILSNDQCTAKRAGEIIRGHWGIENTLHHILDVTFNEDLSRVRKDHGPENLSRIRRLTANLMQINSNKKSIRSQRRNCALSDEFMFNTLLRGLKPTLSA